MLTGVISAAAVALAFGGYLAAFVSFSAVPVAVGVLVVTSAINFWGIEASAKVNVLFTAIEIAGLLFIIAIGIGEWESVEVGALTNGPAGVLHATFLLFFAYVGFESLVNIAEEMETPSRTIPRAIGISIVVSTVVYVLVGFAALGLVDWAVLAKSSAPLADVALAGWGERAFVALLGDLGFVAGLANLALLVVFVVVNLSLLKLRYDGATRADGYRAPLNVGRFSITAFVGVLSSLGLVLFYISQWLP